MTAPDPLARLSRATRVALVVLAAAVAAPQAFAQETRDALPAFSLASSTIFTTRESPAIYLTYQNLERLDFRVYRVQDPVTFLAGLKDPHQLGSEAPLVDQTPTPIERIASWKARWRSRIRSFVRGQFSRDYRRARRERLDEQVVQRRTANVNTFAQVPPLNPSQLVTSWREFLPALRDADIRRIPIDVTAAGMYVVEAVHAPHRAYTIVIVSDVGLVSKAAPGQILLYAANRFTGTPVTGCDVRVIAGQQPVVSGTTNDSGVFEARLAELTQDDVVSVARCGDQVTATDPGSWYLRDAPRELAGYVYTDKPIYRPGHTVHVKGILRWRSRGALLPFDAKEVEVRISDLTDKVIYRQRRPVDAFGGVTADIPLGPGVALGDYAIALLHGDESATGSFEVQEYRKPEFEVRVTPSERFVVQGTEIRVGVDARYYFGQPVANGKLTYVAHRQPYYSPLRWSDDQAEFGGGYWYSDDQTIQGEARLDAEGRASIALPAEPDGDGRDYSLRIEARVTDASNREVAGNAIVHATVGTFLIAATIDQYVVFPGRRSTVTIRAVSYTGEPQPNRQVRVALQQRRPNFGWDDPEGTIDVVSGTVTTDPSGRATWTFTGPNAAGDYRVHARADEGGRAIVDDTYVWVPGPQETTQDDYGYDRYLELIAEKPTVQPGETARFLVRGAEFDSQVLVTKEAQDVSWHQVVHARGNETIEVPITDADVGDTWVNIAFLKDDRLYRAERRVRVPAVSRQLTVTITAEDAVSKPQQPGRFTLKAVDHTGAPVRAQFSLAVIDEAVYGVKADSTPDPLRFFYQRTYSRVGTMFSREYAFVGYSGSHQIRLAGARRPFTLADFKAETPAQPQVRKEFPDAIYWIGDLVTDRNGEAAFSVKYPDALTTWRVTARGATADTLVGAATARTTVTKDLIVRVITPRFLAQGDEAVLPVIAHNYLPTEQAIDVKLDVRGLSLHASSPPAGGATVRVASRGEARVDWRVRADSVGVASAVGTAIASAGADAVELSFPVLPFGLQRTSAKAGSLGTGTAAATLTIPAQTNPAGREITVGLAPSLAGSLLGALDFLTSYPYGCTEQTLSSFLPNLVVSRTMAHLKLEPTERLKLLDRQVTAGLERLLEYQHEDGGWGWWKTDENHPFMTAYAVYGLLETKASGYPVNEWKLRQGVTSIARQYREYPRAVPALKAYMLYVLARAAASGIEPMPIDGVAFDRGGALDEVWRAGDDLTPYGRALLLLAFDALKDRRGDALAAALLGEAKRAGDLAWWEVDRDPLLDDWADTSVEATAMAVQALAARVPADATLEGAVRYMLANRYGGTYWASTKATAMTLYGLTAYMQARGETASPFSVDVSVNGAPARTVAFDERAMTAPDPVLVTVPGREGGNAVTLTKRGGGTLYWSASARYFDTRTPIERTGGRRLAIAREYFTLAPKRVRDRIVYRETPFGGTARPGDVLLVRLTVAGASDWRYLVVEDPLPAGAETIADDSLYQLERARPRPWGGRQEFRDDRAVFFQDGLPNGRAEFWYLLKVVTPGVFTAMPAQVSPMYVPDVFASTTPATVTVVVPQEDAR